MPHVTAHAVTSCAHHAAHACRQAGHPYENMARQKLLMDTVFMPAKQYLIKLTTSHFSTPNMRIANQNILKMILIADMIYIKTQVFRLLRYYSPAPRKIARSDWATQNITHNMTSPIT